VVAAPASVVRDWEFEPALPEAQRTALTSLDYGAATKVILRYPERWWRQPGRPRAFATNMAIGAVWEASEEQKKAACLTLLGGGRASAELSALFEEEGADGLTKRLRWFGARRGQAEAVTYRWENDEWARGGYAYFSPSFDPALRAYLSRGAGRIVFAGSHTSRQFQGYMNGAVESGERAAREIVTLEKMRPR
jgi:monoamine oxidase